jgi:hypothetical protein
MKSKDIKINEKYKVTTTLYAANYNIAKGDVVLVIDKSGASIMIKSLDGGTTTWIEARHLEPATSSKDDLNKQLADAEAQVVDVKARLAYLEESGTDVFDEDEFRCFQALKIAEDTSKSRIERARALGKLVKSGK